MVGKEISEYNDVLTGSTFYLDGSLLELEETYIVKLSVTDEFGTGEVSRVCTLNRSPL